jgi:hypothetical protein
MQFRQIGEFTKKVFNSHQKVGDQKRHSLRSVGKFRLLKPRWSLLWREWLADLERWISLEHSLSIGMQHVPTNRELCLRIYCWKDSSFSSSTHIEAKQCWTHLEQSYSTQTQPPCHPRCSGVMKQFSFNLELNHRLHSLILVSNHKPIKENNIYKDKLCEF